MAMGTLPYMSPEQLQGRHLDQRTDIFSLGVLAYEMATRQRPFLGASSVEISSSILRDTPKSVTELRADLPTGFQKILERCLTKEVAERYGTARELREAVERLRKKVLSGSHSRAANVSQGEASIAVLPFTNMSADPENKFFADGITEEIINALTQIENLWVAARTSAFSFKNKHVDLRIVGERLNVKTVRRLHARRAAECFEHAATLDSEYALAWSGLADAYNMLGLYGFEHPGRIKSEAKAAANRAISLDPRLAESHCSLACSLLMHDWEWKRAEASFLRAAELNPRYLQNLAWYALICLVWTQRRFEVGIAFAQKAVEYDPFSAYAHGELSLVYCHAGRGAEAVKAGIAAKELAESFFTYWVLQHAYHANRQYAEAATAGELALTLSGRQIVALSAQAMILSDWGKSGEAQALYLELLARARRDFVSPTHAAITAATAGEPEKAMAHLLEAVELKDPMVTTVKYWPDVAPLRQHPRFGEILLRRGLS
jgi:tetratricopeptide (TPR) repeat protein